MYRSAERMMKMKCITVQSVTYAQKAKKALQQHGITAYISRQTPNQHSCMWCVGVRENELQKSIQIMRSEKVKMNGDIHDLP